MKGYIVSMNFVKNVYKNGQLLETNFINPKPYPILFFSDKSTDFKSELVNNEELYKIVKPLNAFNFLNYSNVSINGIKYNIDTQEYTEETIDLQDAFLLGQIAEGNDIALNIIEYILDKAYTRCQGDPTIFTDDIKHNITIIYEHIREVYPDQFNAAAIESYMEDKLKNVTHLNDENVEFVFNKFKEIIYAE